jgi:hypothetical protein
MEGPANRRAAARRTLLPLALLLASIAAASPAYALTGPTDASLPAIRLGESARVTLTFVAEATAGSPEAIGTASLTGSSGFTILDDQCSGRSLTGACTLGVRFAPAAAGPHDVDLRVPGAEGEAVVHLTSAGYETGPRVEASPAGLRFAPIAPLQVSSAQLIAFTNTGDLPVGVSRVMVAGGDATQFAVTADACSASELAAGASCAVQVRSLPDRLTGATAELRLLLDDGQATTVALTADPHPPPAPPPLIVTTPPAYPSDAMAFDIANIVYARKTHRLALRLYTTFPARVTVTLTTGRRKVSAGFSVGVGLPWARLPRPLARGTYKITAVARSQRGQRFTARWPKRLPVRR